MGLHCREVFLLLHIPPPCKLVETLHSGTAEQCLLQARTGATGVQMMSVNNLARPLPCFPHPPFLFCRLPPRQIKLLISDGGQVVMPAATDAGGEVPDWAYKRSPVELKAAMQAAQRKRQQDEVCSPSNPLFLALLPQVFQRIHSVHLTLKD